MADETARPSAWSHWTELNLALPAGQGRVVVEATSEVWNYDQEYVAYYDSWRLDGGLGYRWGDVLGPTWKLLMAVENLRAFFAGEPVPNPV